MNALEMYYILSSPSYASLAYYYFKSTAMQVLPKNGCKTSRHTHVQKGSASSQAGLQSLPSFS